jgi:hypothetical protein
MRDDRVEVTEQQQPARARAANPGEQVGGVRLAGAVEALDLGLGRQQRDADRDRLLSSGDVTRRRGDADQRIELALGARANLIGRGRDPVVREARNRGYPLGHRGRIGFDVESFVPVLRVEDPGWPR